ncbi:MBL fold metallo-hydrolase [Butyrivibrio sp. JL13D10]|uniref:MBL fold metallo-hydrolase n=1 Tax=Butyrivibrio sp. JL13D10 TaxID=3236815 RepID=UPI0038B4E865
MKNKDIGTAAVGSMCMGMLQTNCYFIFKEDGNDHGVSNDPDESRKLTPVVFFDPPDRGELIYEELKKRGFKVEGIYLTHGHFDHMMGAGRLKELSGVKVYAYEKEAMVCEDFYYNLSSMFGVSASIKPDVLLRDGEMCECAGLSFKTIATPGHTQGGCCYYFEDDNILISGDSLFNGSVGRTDFPGGSAATLTRSCHEKLFCLPDDTVVYPGHGETTTIGFEKTHNMYL